MPETWHPKKLRTQLSVEVAYNRDQIWFRFRWSQPDPGGWLHDMLVYRDGRWHRLAEPSPWAARSDHDEHTGFYEDRVSFLLDDGSVTGFEQFGGWLTAHTGARSMPSEVSQATVESHDHFGELLEQTDIRKYIPQACAGEWWENDWQDVRPTHELEALKADGVFLDLPMWRAHRSNPKGYGTDHHVLDYRHDDRGQNTYTTQAWDADDGPAYMWDPEILADGALDYFEIRDGEIPDQQSGIYALETDDAVEFDPAVAEWEGAMIPRCLLREPHGSAADWRANGVWDDGEWTVELWRDLQPPHPDETTQLAPGEVYTWSPALHHGAGQRWHWVAYPYKLGLGVEPNYTGAAHTDGTTELVAEAFSGERPDWDDHETYTIPLIFPGVLEWSDLTSDEHPQADRIRTAEITMWECYENDPESFLE